MSPALSKRRPRPFAAAMLALTLLVAQCLLLLHESEVTAHADEASCEICLALQVMDDSLPLSGEKLAAVHAGDHPRQAGANESLPGRLAVIRSRGPPTIFS